MHWGAALQIGKREGRLAITAVGCSQQREEGCILTYRQELPIAECPTGGRKVKWKNSDFSDKRISHVFSPFLILRRENSLERNTEIKHQIRLHIGMRLAATNVGDGSWMHRCIWCGRGVLRFAIVGPKVSGGVAKGRVNGSAANTQIATECMRVLWQLLYVQSDGR
jgi:hypothetical protein